jgi:hypothetical protein
MKNHGTNQEPVPSTFVAHVADELQDNDDSLGYDEAADLAAVLLSQNWNDILVVTYGFDSGMIETETFAATVRSALASYGEFAGA